MKDTTYFRSASRWLAGGAGLAAAVYAGYVGVTWYRFGRATQPRGNPDPLLDGFMPVYDVIERHRTEVSAPAAITLAAARNVEMNDSPIVRAIFTTREWALGGKSAATRPPRGLLAQVKAFGWGVLAEVPNREIVMGAVTQPWTANPVFRAIPAAEFAAFSEPGYVKIAWTLRADPLGPDRSFAITETRAVATDLVSRQLFRRYWAFVSPGIIVIRLAMLRQIRRAAEQHVSRAGAKDRENEVEVEMRTWPARVS